MRSRMATSSTHSVRISIAWRTSSSAGNVGAIRMLRSFGSRPCGKLAPAGVRVTPASAATVMTCRAQPSGTSKLTKYPPAGFDHRAICFLPNSRWRISSTRSNFGFKSFILDHVYLPLVNKNPHEKKSKNSLI